MYADGGEVADVVAGVGGDKIAGVVGGEAGGLSNDVMEAY
ncbi:hypothetical protein A2U01_0088657, partial [Trifolium medium]|nr:hypothetical protein [Trifolium medium]